MVRILIVDDECIFADNLKMRLSDMGYQCISTGTVSQAQEIIKTNNLDLILLDMNLPDGRGIDLIRFLKSEGLDLPVIVITGYASIANAVEAMREGAVDYVQKSQGLEQIGMAVERNLEVIHLRGQVELYTRTKNSGTENRKPIGVSQSFQTALQGADKAAKPGVETASEMPTVLLTGETGTGKDLLAGYIHAQGPLAVQPFIHVDCTALPRELIESELFGHERGAFTGAKTRKRGLLEMAAGGTVFLNEIGELPIELQAKLLRLLEGLSFRRVGGTRDIEMNIRIIAATNANLEERVSQKTFRRDLFYRLNSFRIDLPPLRKRERDVLLLADHFIRFFSRKYSKEVASISGPGQEGLLRHDWPGNVRELRHMIQQAVLLQKNGLIDLQHLGIIGAVMITGLKGEQALIEYRRITETLEAVNGNLSQAAQKLGMSRSTLRRRLFAVDETNADCSQ